MVVVTVERWTSYIIGDAIYLIWPYLQEIWKNHDAIDVDKQKYDSSMNSGRAIIENASGSLKNRWHILRHFSSRVDKVSRVVVCCILHNYCLE
jgi:hypothetical protein